MASQGEEGSAAWGKGGGGPGSGKGYGTYEFGAQIAVHHGLATWTLDSRGSRMGIDINKKDREEENGRESIGYPERVTVRQSTTRIVRSLVLLFRQPCFERCPLSSRDSTLHQCLPTWYETNALHKAFLPFLVARRSTQLAL